MILLVHFFGPLKLALDTDTGRVVSIESRLPSIPVSAFTGTYLAAAVRDAEAFAHSQGYGRM
jgi:hypothetical protein